MIPRIWKVWLKKREFIQVIQCCIFIPIWEYSHFDIYFSEGLKPPTRRGFKNARMLSTIGNADLPIMWLKSMGIQRPLKCFEDMDWWVINGVTLICWIYLWRVRLQYNGISTKMFQLSTPWMMCQNSPPPRRGTELGTPWQELLETYARLLVHCLEAFLRLGSTLVGWVGDEILPTKIVGIIS